MTSYKELGNWLKAVGIGSYMQNPDHMVISNKNPAMPGSNCFWVTLKDNQWFLGTFLPAVYLVPPDQNIGEVCDAVFHSSSTALWTIGQNLIDRFNLKRLAEDQIDNLQRES